MTEPAFEAKYEGECVAGCGDPIMVGDRIIHEGGKQYMHEWCTERHAANIGEDGKRHPFEGTSLDEMGF